MFGIPIKAEKQLVFKAIMFLQKDERWKKFQMIHVSLFIVAILMTFAAAGLVYALLGKGSLGMIGVAIMAIFGLGIAMIILSLGADEWLYKEVKTIDDFTLNR